MTFFGDGDEVLPGIKSHASFGHTPGHMSFEVRSGTDALLVGGDAIGNHHIAFARPDWASGSDQDPSLAATTRSACSITILRKNYSAWFPSAQWWHWPRREKRQRIPFRIGGHVMKKGSLLAALTLSSAAYASEDIADKYPNSLLYDKPVEVIPGVFLRNRSHGAAYF